MKVPMKFSMLAVAVAGSFAFASAFASTAGATTTSTTSSGTNSFQVTGGNSAAGGSFFGGIHNKAKIEDNAANGATGNVGINVAAGTGNAQGNTNSITSTYNAGPANSKLSTDNDQITGVNETEVGQVFNTALMVDHAGYKASGNIGVNSAAGTGNAQSNQMALASVTNGYNNGQGTSAAATSNFQMSLFNEQESFGQRNVGVLAGSALAGAHGNIGVNIASGEGNAQSNALAVGSYTGAGGNVSANGRNAQLAMVNYTQAGCDAHNKAVLAGYALAGATGNVGANIAAGVGNLQSNSLTMVTGKQ